MESYLYREEYIQEVVLNIFRIMGNFDVKAFMASVEHICRFLFHLHGLLIPLNAKMVDIDKILHTIGKQIVVNLMKANL